MKKVMKAVKVCSLEPAHVDDRGEIWDLCNEQISHVGMITSRAGVSRANHYHKQSVQYTYILSGKFEVTFFPVNAQQDAEKVLIREGDLIEIPPGIVHRFKAIEDSTMIEMGTLSRQGDGYERDVVRLEIK